MENKDNDAVSPAAQAVSEPPVAFEAEASQAARYSRVAVMLHWAIAALIIVNIVTGLLGANTKGDFHRQILDWHKPLGIIILLLSLARLGWRLGQRPPPSQAYLSTWEKVLAKTVHWGFYAVMIVQPLTGWWLSSAVPVRHPFGWLGVLEVPYLPVAQSMANAGAAHSLHVWIGFSTIGLLALHLAGVFKHQVVDRRDVLHRMTVSGRA